MALILASAWTGTTRAQDADAPAAASPSATVLRRVTTACQAEMQRFCPALSGTPSARSQAICLRPYRTSLSLGCRSAVNALTRQSVP